MRSGLAMMALCCGVLLTACEATDAGDESSLAGTVAAQSLGDPPPASGGPAKTQTPDAPPAETPAPENPPATTTGCGNCDDGNVCTEDHCVQGVCDHRGLTGHACDDGSACTANDACKGRVCQGAATNCDDGDPCTTDTCEAANGCAHKSRVGEACDDRSDCTTADVCTDDGCVGQERSCDDGNECTAERCDIGIGCVYTDLQDVPCSDGEVCTLDDACKDRFCIGRWNACDDGNECTDDGCGAGKGCWNTAHNGKRCEDNDACTVDEYCWDSACGNGAGVPCNDGNVCTADACDPALGCTATPAPGACDDGSACTTGDACSGGACVGAAKNCDDGNACTKDTCQAGVGCVSASDEGASCSDGSACTSGDTCHASACAGTTVTCDDGNVCTADACDPASGCTTSNTSGNACDDGSACTAHDACGGGHCAGGAITCNDGNVCTTDSCDPATGCVFPNQEGTACDDGTACTEYDTCAGGGCAGKDITCNDGNPCVTVSCDPAKGCSYSNDDGESCNDGSLCTTSDTCFGGVCSGKDVECDDGNVCTLDACNAAQGCIHGNEDGVSCDDGSACTNDDVCFGGGCTGHTVTCDDHNPCTIDGCQPGSGCTVTPDNGLACDDSDKCTQGDTCQAGHCGGATVDCDDGNVCTIDSCEASIGCFTRSDDGVVCNDGNACTDHDTCLNDGCYGSAVGCDDGNPCTADGCDTGTGCTVKNLDNIACNDGSACTKDDTCGGAACAGSAITCNDGNACTSDACNPATGCTTANLDGSACNDGNACTSSDTCGGGGCAGKAVNCDDGNVCTADTCNPASGCANTAVANGASCSDGVACTSGDHCVSGVCQGSPVVCNDNNGCTNDSCDTATGGCTYAPANGQPCNDGNYCTQKDKCWSAACSGEPVTCNDGNSCTNDACNPAAGCYTSAVANGTVCSDGNGCTAVACPYPVTERFAITNALGTPYSVTPYANHGFVFGQFWSGYDVVFTFYPGSYLDLHPNGTATLTGVMLCSVGAPGYVGTAWTASIKLKYRGQGTAGQGWGGPKLELLSGYQPASITNTWRYFDMVSGTITRNGTGEYATVWQYPVDGKHPMQLGARANGKNLNNGVSQWFGFSHYYGPTTSGHGDINVDMTPTTAPACPTHDQCIAGTCTGSPVFWSCAP